MAKTNLKGAVPENSTTKPASHLRSYMVEVMAGLRYEAMSLLVNELMFAFTQEGYQLDEFLFALAGYVGSQGWEEVERYLESASTELAKIRRVTASQATKDS